jgi:hypothetical protein
MMAVKGDSDLKRRSALVGQPVTYAIAGLLVTLPFGVVITVGWVAAHFIVKFW